MFNFLNKMTKLAVIAVISLTFAASVTAKEKYGFGKAATAKEIAGWDIDIRPDGKGLPPGSGSVEDGEPLYEAKCAMCHGSFGEGEGAWPKLAGGQGTLLEERPEKSVGSYWPYASTLWDYIHRAMPFTAPQSLTDDEVYAITAYVLYLNEIVEDDFVLTQDNFAEVKLPNEENFYVDDRPDIKAKRCMKNCVDPTKFNIRKTLAMQTDHGGEQAVVEEVAAHPGEATYEAACKMCHASGLAGAPTTGDKEAWAARIGKGIDVLYNSALKGIGAMPAKGGQMQLSDDAVKQAVDFMVETSK
ncbi:MAG: c-type cytochrome [Kangiellaceae bacterium]|jgi:cytochrome c|nr:c-type cytochrome [Kangiellaceae bacterium]